MKSLKRTLSLVLVLTMVLGLFGIAGAAFTDQADVKYKEAVGVMTGIGAIDGYADGSVKPTGAITREEAAKLVAYAILGADVAKNLKASVSSFSDVAATRWSAPYIAYCVKEGIINGMGDGTFAPTSNVTGYQLAKMMLCAAGYGAKGEYTGAGWELAVAVDANKFGIFENAVSVNFSAAATREEAMLYVFNGIFVDQVEYNTVFGSYLPNTGLNGTATTIAQDTYGASLAATSTTDAFGNAAVNWTYKGVDIGTYTRDVAYTYTKNMNTTAGKKELTSTFKGFTVNLENETKIQLNGADTGSVLTAANLVDELATVTANGRTVRVYVYPNNLKSIRAISAFDTELAQVSNINATTKTVTVTTIGNTKYTADSDNSNYKALSAMKVKDYVLVTHVGTEVATIATPSVVTGKLTNIGYTSNVISSVTVGGTSYPVSAMEEEISSLTSTSLSATKDVTLYVDSNGFAIYIDDVTATTPYLMVAKLSSSLVNNVVVKTATGYAPDGTVVTLNIGDGSAASGSVAIGTLYSYAAADSAWATAHDAEYKLTAVPFVADGDQAAEKTYAPNNGAINLGDTTFIGDDDNGGGSKSAITAVPYASDVKFIFITTNGVTVKSGVQKVTAANTAKALFTKNASGTLVVSAVYVGVDPVDVSSSLLYLARYDGITTVGGKAVYSYIAMIDGAPTPITSKANDTVGTFYTYVKDETTGVYSLTIYGTLGTKTGVKNATTVNDVFKSLTVGYILETAAATDGTTTHLNLNAKNAAIIDLTQTGVNTLSDIADAKAAGKIVILSTIYDDDANSPTYKTVTTVYVVAVVTPVTAATTTGDSFTFNATTGKYVLRVDTAGNTGTISFTGLPTGVTIAAAASGTAGTATVTATPTNGVTTVTTVAGGDTLLTLTTAAGKFTVPVAVEVF